ncbi:MAG: glycosyltransferase [Acidobacteriia bacterium]|nr:glycosyltransferase [Terriglobia bacterium]
MITLDTTAWTGAGVWAQRFNQRTYLGSSVRAMNVALQRAVAEHRPDLVWMDKAMWAYPWVLRRLRRDGRFVVHYNTDDVFAPRHHFWLHRLGLKACDLFLTTNRFNIKEIRRRYGVRAMRVGMGYDREIHIPAAPVADTETPSLVFVGHWQPQTEAYITALRSAGLPVRVWGAQWHKARDRGLRAVTPLGSNLYVRTIAQAAIALCMLSHSNRNESTGRSFEIPAIGTFMLAERTHEHEFLYRDGVGAALFSNEQELLEKSRYYLNHFDERREIANRGAARCRALGLSWDDHIRREWPLVERAMGGDTTWTAEDDRPFWPGFRRGEDLSAS